MEREERKKRAFQPKKRIGLKCECDLRIKLTVTLLENPFRDMMPNHLGAPMTSQRIKATAHTERWDGCQLLSFLLHLHMKRKRKSRPAEEYHI